jgi:hypothetical protein
MSNTLKLGNGQWATGKDTILAYNDLNSNYKPLAFSFSRASSGTVVNKDGLIETVGSGEPRIDFKDNTKGALLLEPQRSNLLSYSEPTSSETSASGVTYELFNWNLGFTNCIKFGDNSQTRYRYFTGTIANSTQYTISAFVIMDDLSEPVLGTTTNNGDLIFRVGGQSATTGNLPNVNMGNNIYRLSSIITSTSVGGTTGLLKYSGQSNKGFRIVGFQVEQGSYATSYIPTSGSAVTRVAESSSQTPPDGVIGQTEGTMFLDFNIDDISSQTQDPVLIYLKNSSGIKSYLEMYDNGDFVAVHINSGSITLTKNGLNDGRHKAAFAYKDNDFAFYVDGVLAGSNTNFTVASSQTEIGLQYTSVNYTGKQSVNDVKLYNTRLSNSELAALTTI